MRHKKSEAEWRTIIKDIKENGLSQKELCKKYNISSSSYYRHKEKQQSVKEPINDFIKVPLEEPKRKESVAEIVFPNGLKLKVSW